MTEQVNEHGSIKRRLFPEAVHILALSGFAVAQPIYDLLGRSAEFFIAHNLSPAGILAFVVALSAGLPAVLIILEWLTFRFSPSLQRVVHIVFVFVLLTLIVAPILKRLPETPAYASLGAAVIVGAFLTGIYVRISAARSFVSILAVGATAFPVMLLTLTPVSDLVFPTAHEKTQTDRPSVKKPTPIVFVIFDEFEAGALLDADKQIDSVRFPHFAKLAEQSLWFPHATTVWTVTKRAVPAILTGLKPRDPDELPTVQSHPNNLFTWLGQEGYRLNVSEPLTSLCPSDLCRRAQGDRDFDGVLFLSDLSIVYLHIILPTSLADTFLPRLDADWKGFVPRRQGARKKEPANGSKDFRAEFNQIVNGDRHPLVTSFIESITPDEKKSLHFLHVLLPHDPYLYLPSGKMYLGGGTEGLIDRVWTSDDLLPKLGYQRYLLQVGFVDTMVGRLVAHLKAVGLYDEALVIFTADHGKSFRPGQPKRVLAANVKSNASDLMQVPLFIKLPGQTRGQRSDRRALTVDIMPTIADVLGATLPWTSHGFSLIDDKFPEREVLEIADLDGSGAAQQQFDAAELTSYPSLAWKIETFGERTPLDRLRIADAHSALVGQPLTQLNVGEETAGLELHSDQFGLFEDVQLESGVLPALFQGHIASQTAIQGTLNLAIAVNGVIEVTTRTTSWANTPLYFAALIPEPSFRQGKNHVEVHLIETTADGLRLSRISAPAQDRFQIDERRGSAHLVSASKESVALVPDAVRGNVDNVDDNPRWYTLHGWAVDMAHMKPAVRLLLFVDGKQVFSGVTSRNRPDIVRHFGNPNVLASGFRFNVPKAVLDGHAMKIRMFAVSRDGVASELVVSPRVREFLTDRSNS